MMNYPVHRTPEQDRAEFDAAEFDLPQRLAAMKIATALNALAPDEQARVVRWALARFWPENSGLPEPSDAGDAHA